MSALTDRLDEIEARSEKTAWVPPTDEGWERSIEAYLNAGWDGRPDDYDRMFWEAGYRDGRYEAAHRAAVPTIIEALRAVLELHKPIDIKVVDDPLCIMEECDHYEECQCPETGTLTICAGCDDMCESAYPYYSETNIHVVVYPCPTAIALWMQ